MTQKKDSIKMGEISNKVSYAISLIEVTLLSGCVWERCIFVLISAEKTILYKIESNTLKMANTEVSKNWPI